jgi:hypothetical protein
VPSVLQIVGDAFHQMIHFIPGFPAHRYSFQEIGECEPIVGKKVLKIKDQIAEQACSAKSAPAGVAAVRR